MNAIVSLVEPTVEQIALFTVSEMSCDAQGKARWRRPTAERASWWFARMRAAVNEADTTCLLCGRVVEGNRNDCNCY